MEKFPEWGDGCECRDGEGCVSEWGDGEGNELRVRDSDM